MKLRSTYKCASGFTLLEVLLVVAMIVGILQFGVVYGVENFRRVQFYAEKDLLVGLLQQARSAAMANISQKPHGVAVEFDKYIVFAGVMYDPLDSANVVYSSSSAISKSGNSHVIFSALSGDVVDEASFILQKNELQTTIFINHAGQITW